METETDTEVCDCRNLPEHGPLCPENTDPRVCEWCREAFDPAEADRADWCMSDHCADCGADCRPCTRPARIA